MPTVNIPLSGALLATIFPDTNWGGSALWYANNSNGSTVIRWDPLQIPAGRITGAALNIHLNHQLPSFNPGTQLNTYTLLPTSNWVLGSAIDAIQAGSACWNFQAYNTRTWAAGAFSFTADTDVIDNRSPVMQAIAAGWNVINIPADWVRTYNGVVLQSNQSGTDTYFDSQNASSNQPYLSVTYDPTQSTRSFLAHTYDVFGWCQANPWQRKTFFAAGLYWTFYTDPTDSIGNNPKVSYKTSPDGGAWSAPVLLRDLAGTYEFDGDVITFAVSGTDIHYVSGEPPVHAGFNGLYYRKGTLNSDGTITWAASEQTIINTGGYTEAYIWPDLILDSNGFPWIGVSHAGPSIGGGFNAPWDRVVYKSATKDGTWVTDTGFPHSLGGFPNDLPDSNQPWVAMHGCALLNGDMLWMWPNRDGSSTSYKWDGTALTWGSTETLTGMQITAPLFQFNGKARFVGKDNSGGLSYAERSTSGVWTSPSSLVTQAGISIYNITATDRGGGKLRIFWARDPAVNSQIWYIDIDQTGAAISSPTVEVDESTEKIGIGQTSLQTLPKVNGKHTLVTYTTLSGAPFNLRSSLNTIPGAAVPIFNDSYRRRRR